MEQRDRGGRRSTPNRRGMWLPMIETGRYCSLFNSSDHRCSNIVAPFRYNILRSSMESILSSSPQFTGHRSVSLAIAFKHIFLPPFLTPGISWSLFQPSSYESPLTTPLKKALCQGQQGRPSVPKNTLYLSEDEKHHFRTWDFTVTSKEQSIQTCDLELPSNGFKSYGQKGVPSDSSLGAGMRFPQPLEDQVYSASPRSDCNQSLVLSKCP